MPVVTAFYGALIALLGFILSMRVIRQRRGKRIGLGDGGDAALARASRVFGNFTEYAPLFVILLALAELTGVPLHWLHLYGVLFTAGRIAHALGLGRSSGASAGRVGGMVATQLALIGLAVTLLIVSIPRIL